MLEFDSLQSAIKFNPPMTFKKKLLWNPLTYCPRNCTKFLSKIHLSHSNKSLPCPQEMVYTWWSFIRFKLPENSTHQWLSRRNGYGTPFNYCSPNCTKFLFKIHLSHSNKTLPCPQEMVYTWWSFIRFKLPENSTHQWLSRRNGYGTPFNYRPPNFSEFLFKIHLSHSNQS